MTSERSRQGRAVAEDTLLLVMYEISDPDAPLVLMGGLMPEILTRDQNPPVPQHLGTADVDLLLDFHVKMEDDLSHLESALLRSKLHPSPGYGGWRWVGSPAGATVKIEFLCELDNQPAEARIRPRGCQVLSAINLRGAGFVHADSEPFLLSGSLPGGKNVSVRIRAAGLGGYLLAKAVALKERSLDRDYYDFAYVLLYNRLGGPAPAAEALRQGPHSGRMRELHTVWREVQERFGASDRDGPTGYADQAIAADPSSDPARLRLDAVAAVSQFLDRLGVL